MKRVKSYEALAPLLGAQLRRGVVTNCALGAEDWRRELAAGSVYAQDWEGGLLLLRRRGDHFLLYFYLQEGAAPPDGLDWEGPTVLEIAARPRDEGLLRSVELWRERGFQTLFHRERLTLPGNTRTSPGDGALEARMAGPADAAELWALLQDSFDPLTGCLPTREELAADVEAGNVVCLAGRSEGVAGVLHIAPGRGSTQLRHLAVDESCRRQGGAQAMLACYLERTGFAKSLVWVRVDNQPGRSFYLKNGYAPDGWGSAVLYRP